MKRFACILLVLILMLPAVTFAEGGNGSGGGGGDAVSVASTSIEDGTVIGPEDSITLTFTNNVNNQKVRETNQTMFSLADENGNPVEIEVIMYDDQVEPEHKRDITVVPAAPLADGVYTLTAHAGITAKNGSSMAEDFILTFTVSSENPAAVAVATEEPTAAPTMKPTEKPAEATAEPVAAPSTQSFGLGIGAWIIIAVAVVVIATIVIIFIVRNKHRKA